MYSDTEKIAPRITNMNDNERVASIAGGAFLLFDGIFNKNFRVWKLGIAAALLARGISGSSMLYRLSGRPSAPHPKNINIRTEFYVNKSPEEAYAVWRKLENLPHFMKHLASVKEVYENISEWKAHMPGNPIPITWRACIVKDEPGKFLSWRSLPDSMINTSGRVNFVSVAEEWGTLIQINVSYQPEGLLKGALVEFFHPALEKMIRQDLDGFKSYIDGDVAENSVL